MKKLSKIQESVWANLHSRGIGETIREEDGQKVHTCLGVDIIIQDGGVDYDGITKALLNREDNSDICNPRYMGWTQEEMTNIRNWEAMYAYLIYDGKYGDSLVVEFKTYDEFMEDFENEFDVSEEDYISICKGVATALKEVGRNLSDGKVSNKNNTLHQGHYKSSYCDSYSEAYCLVLIDERRESSWEADNKDADWTDFLTDLVDQFPELNDIGVVSWTYSNNGIYIGVPVLSDTLINFKQYKEFTEKWFNL